MVRRPPGRFARTLALLATGVLISGTGVVAPALLGAASADLARAETQRIGDGARATAPDRVPVGGEIRVSGRNWTAVTGGGSVIAVRLDDGEIPRSAPVTNPATGDVVSDSSIVAAVRASNRGSFKISVPVPRQAGWTAGSRHSIRLTTGKLLSDDATRSVALTFDLIDPRQSRPTPDPTPTTTPTQGNPKVDDQQKAQKEPTEAPTSDPTASAAPKPSVSSTRGPTNSARATGGARERTGQRASSVPPRRGNSKVHQRRSTASKSSDSGRPPKTGGAACDVPKATLSSATTIRDVPAIDLGGTLTISGQGFCHPAGGGSTIAVQIDDGRLKRVEAPVHRDPTIWQIIEAADDGSFHATIAMPQADQTDPAFADGSHRLRLLTGAKLETGDAVRSVRTGEFVVATGNHTGILPEPTKTPTPVDPVVALVGSRAGAVTAKQTDSTVRVVVPGVEPGDWVFPYTFREEQRGRALTHPTTWLQVDANRSVTFDLAAFGVAGQGATRVSLQARDGTLVGWTQVAAFPAAAAPVQRPVSGAADRGQPPSAEPRPLVLITGGGLLLLGLAWMAIARRWRRRTLRDLNGE